MVSIFHEVTKSAVFFAPAMLYVFYALWTWKYKPENFDRALKELLAVFLLLAFLKALDLLLAKAGGDFRAAMAACGHAREQGAALQAAYGNLRMGLGMIPIVGYILFQGLDDVCGWAISLIRTGTALYAAAEAAYFAFDLVGDALIAAGAALIPPPNTRRWGALLIAVYVSFALMAPPVESACSAAPSLSGLEVAIREYSGKVNGTLTDNPGHYNLSFVNYTEHRRAILNIADALGAAAPEYFRHAEEAAVYLAIGSLSVTAVALVLVLLPSSRET